MSSGIPSDIQSFLDNYPNKGDNLRLDANLKFYSGTLHCQPDGLLINELHDEYVKPIQSFRYNTLLS